MKLATAVSFFVVMFVIFHMMKFGMDYYLEGGMKKGKKQFFTKIGIIGFCALIFIIMLIVIVTVLPQFLNATKLK